MDIGLIGCGLWGRQILSTLLKLAVRVVVYDINPEHCDQALQLGAIDATPHLDSLKQARGIIVATPATTHRAVLEQIRFFDKPIFVEKPLTTSYADALAIANLGLPPTFLMHIWRYHPGIRLLGDLQRAGNLGRLLTVRTSRTNWTSPRLDTDSLWTLAPHDLTIIQQILGYIPAPRAVAAERHGKYIRSLTAILGNDPGCIIDVSTRYADKRREVRLQGTEGVAVLANEQTNAIDIWYGNDRTSVAERQHEQLFFDSTPPLELELAAFIEYLRGGPPPLSPLAEGIDIVRLIDAIEQLA
ncbi:MULTISPECIES: Gfo/Idh/MocA family oxidoreductase [unclassified Spirosoma]|uniref:Gfo/Idh/MocA family protein n=1 Tax=unclassified Spirosoma TaxID=2621999 RepID=UPI00096A1A71|nr:MULTISPECIES: Gfo/Idh/MocA family oxidoreductase [unclassified Spirosoma]MBN8824630.1 Gfo/Idh/MocA family oxidoreductase [Spirosoma sp.]OJW78816.1 MAG: oxidoreductase [Spirosoma sp. 48-14]